MADDDKELKDQRVVTMMSPSELEAIDDWMFRNRIRSRGEAIRRLCHIGMIADETPLMKLAMHVLAHYIEKDDNVDPKLFSSGDSLTTDIKRLCWMIFEERSRMGGFRDDRSVKEAMKLAARLKDDYARAAKGTHLEKE